MIRRMFWLVLGAVLGVSGYRRASALARSLAPGSGARRRSPGTGGLSPVPARTQQAVQPLPPAAGSGAAAGLAPARVSVARSRVREVARFAADVRDGMEIYTARHPRRPPNTLERQQARSARPAAGAQRAGRPEQAEDGR